MNTSYTQAALSAAGLEGQSVRVRTSGGKVVVGQAVGDKLVEITL